MNREIKFRAWSKILERMKTMDELEFSFSTYHLGKALKEVQEDCFLMQYTGLKDKNGKDCYEGDVVTNNDEIWDIYYAEGAWKMGLNGRRTNNDHLFLLEPTHSEIIGNIYSNPELLTPPLGE